MSLSVYMLVTSCLQYLPTIQSRILPTNQQQQQQQLGLGNTSQLHVRGSGACRFLDRDKTRQDSRMVGWPSMIHPVFTYLLCCNTTTRGGPPGYHYIHSSAFGTPV
ncbi:hypothetical protein QBC32DRAFT_125982 [Pseudoneurospora amorphoporcata]|uniref:Uncharacterized protein n=1 Tax=Pseudoneurospora amorphoporcata TaxID=241081 RepID=A0AAN6SH15_9PEZI|nr:hypothetical protein QBC32DRAFT_125982 [Pseudoneurospora amorphoporcata]